MGRLINRSIEMQSFDERSKHLENRSISPFAVLSIFMPARHGNV